VLIIEAYLFGGCLVDNGPFSSEETVKARMKHILEKLGASDPTQAVTIAAGNRFIHEIVQGRQLS